MTKWVIQRTTDNCYLSTRTERWMNEVHIFYHKSDSDGKAAGAVSDTATDIVTIMLCSCIHLSTETNSLKA